MIRFYTKIAPLFCVLSFIVFNAQQAQANTLANASISMPIVVLSVSTMPAKANLITGQKLPFIAMGEYSDDTTRDITSLVHWSSSNPAVARVDKNGVVSAISSGHAIINASLMNVSGQSTVHVS